MTKRQDAWARKQAARREDLEWMAKTGESAINATKRLGITYHGLERWARNHAPEAWKTLVANNPRDHNLPAGRTGLGRFLDDEVA